MLYSRVKCILHSSCLAYGAGFANLDGELGTAHHFNDVEGRPADVIAQHLELEDQERKWIVRMLMISAHSEQHTAQYKQRLDDCSGKALIVRHFFNSTGSAVQSFQAGTLCVGL